ncbi:uncharacterized protein METZ01_LOCUS507829 [marine metagenome]|uniref:SelT/selW/selH selenoprotein domain-containing protein n=1 Tax=marine metagenome TaxID=408172 RepID=A0A383EF68_9ZZZZ
MNDVLPKIFIRYCPRCKWLPRACWMAQELLSTFSEKLGDVALSPDHETAGLFRIELNGELLWCRKRDGGFPEIKTLKQRVRDSIAPELDLGHLEDPKTDPD